MSVHEAGEFTIALKSNDPMTVRRLGFGAMRGDMGRSSR